MTLGKSCSPLSFEFPISTVGNCRRSSSLITQAPQKQLCNSSPPRVHSFWVSYHCEWHHHHLVYLGVIIDATLSALYVVSPQVLCMPAHSCFSIAFFTSIPQATIKWNPHGIGREGLEMTFLVGGCVSSPQHMGREREDLDPNQRVLSPCGPWET